MEWYAIETKPKHEALAKALLDRLSIETFYPQIKREKIIRRVRQTVIKSLFPGYLFARFDLKNQYRAVNFSQGVKRVVSFGVTPAVVDNAIIEAIKANISTDGFISIPQVSICPGQKVMIQAGPLKGFEAIFEQEMSDRQRAVLLLRALSYQARVIVPLEYVVNY
jgi:transcriptional antiterminator RfaH